MKYLLLAVLGFYLPFSRSCPAMDAAASPATAPASAAIVPKTTKKLLVLNIDPILESAGGVRLNAFMKWQDPRKLNEGYLRCLTEASGGLVKWEVTAWVDLDLWPRKMDGFRYDDEGFVACWKDPKNHSFHQPDAVDYAALLDTPIPEAGGKSAHQLAAGGEVDEVLVWAHPYSGFYESRMVGETAYWCNAPALHRASRLYVVMGLNPERGVAEALHSFGHRSESILKKVYGSWSQTGEIKHLWDRYSRVGPLHAGVPAGCGNVHFPPNASQGYAYDVKTAFPSEAAQWLRFPDLSGRAEPVSAEEWNGPDYHLNYMCWWLNHLPKAPGRYEDPVNPLNHGKLNNWWAYLTDMNAQAESR